MSSRANEAAAAAQESIREAAAASEAEEKEKDPKIYNLQWIKEEKRVRGSRIIKEVTLRASVLNMEDGESVTFTVKTPTETEGEEETVTELSGTVKDKQVEVVWEIEDRDAMESSGDAENYSLSNLHWEKDGKETSKAFVNDEVYLCADVEGAKDGQSVPLDIYEKDDRGDNDYLDTVKGIIKQGKIKLKWTVTYTEDNDDTENNDENATQGYTTPEYIFKGTTEETAKLDSSLLQVKGWLKVQLKKQDSDEVYADTDYILHLPDGSKEEGTTDAEGYINKPEIDLGYFEIELKEDNNE